MVNATTLKKIVKPKAVSANRNHGDGGETAFIVNFVAEAFIDCIYEGNLEDTQAMWYLELIRGMYESNNSPAAFIILNAVLHYAESSAAPMINDLYMQLHKAGKVKHFFEAFFEHDDIDDLLLNLTIHRACIVDTDKLLN